MRPRDLTGLLAALDSRTDLSSWTPDRWDGVIRQARSADLMARIAASVRDGGHWEAVPAEVRRHLQSAQVLADRQQAEIRMELDALVQALSRVNLPVVLLKGCAYAMAGHRAAKGRMVSDIDILVPRDRLGDAETALMMAGWISSQRDAYDQRYYRQWMHELPPLVHMKRGTMLDVHHAILPLTARLKPDTRLLLSGSRALDEQGRLHVLAPTDMVLHSAAHLFHEGELGLGLRGLLDLDALLREFSIESDFWRALLQRARLLDLEWPLYFGLRYTRIMLDTPIPDHFIEQVKVRARISALRLKVMDALYLRGLCPDHASLSDTWTPLARFVLYLRGHWLRMPPVLLAKHLLHKLVITHKSEEFST